MDASTSAFSVLLADDSPWSWPIVPSQASFVPYWESLVINSPQSWGIFTSWTEVKPVVPVEMPNSFSNVLMLLTHRKYLIYVF